jgi:hypothetical protein
MFPIASHFLSYLCFAQLCPLGMYRSEQILGLICFYVWSEYFYIGWGGRVSKVFELFVMGQSKKLFAQKTYELGR